MGQTSSHSVDKAKKLGTLLQIDKEAVNIHDYMSPGSDEKNCLCVNSDKNSLYYHNQKWKKEIINQLKSLDLPVWPQLLIKILKKINGEQSYDSYQIELFWVDTHYVNLKDKTAGQKFELIAKLGAHNDSMNPDFQNSFEGQYSLQAQSASNLGRVAKNLLDSSDILEDKLINYSKDLSYAAQSYNPIISNEMENYSKSYGYPISNNRKKQPIEEIFSAESKISLWKKRHITAQKYMKSSYNMLKHQVPLANGMDGRSINDKNELYLAIEKYKIITNLIAKHLEQEEHIFNKLLNEFESYFIKQYEALPNSFKLGKVTLKECETLKERGTKDLQQFILIFYEALDQFYCLENLNLGKQPRHELLFNRNNMINFVTSLVFRPRIHNIVFDLYSITDEAIEQAYKKNLQKCFALKPEDYGVSEAYCLNEKTEKFLNKSVALTKSDHDFVLRETKITTEKNSKEVQIEEKKGSEIQNLPKKDFSLMHKLINESKKANVETKDQVKAYFPYQKAIKTLKTITIKNSPIQKLKTIVLVAELVNEAIENFYNRFGVTNEEKLSGDDTFAIFMYIIGKSEINNLVTHCKIVQKFSTNNILSSISGYYAITLEACVNYICEMNLPDNFTAEQLEASLNDYVVSLGKSALN